MTDHIEVFYFKDQVLVTSNCVKLFAVISFLICCNEIQIDSYSQLKYAVQYLENEVSLYITVEEILARENLSELKELRNQVMHEAAWYELTKDLEN